MLGELRAALRWTFSGGARQTYRGGTWYGDNVLGNDEAEEIVRAFGRFLAERQPVIPDVDRLPHRKIKIWEAFKKWEQDLCDWGNIHRESGNTKMEKAVKAQLENIRGCQVILWGYSRIDPEDKAAVKYFNSFRRFKDVPEGKRHEAIELRLKYSERGQAEVMAWELGAAYRQAGRTDDATAAFVEARKLNPELFK